LCFILAEGNKCDKANLREIPQYVGEDFARRNDMKFIETSAKEAENVDALFYDIARELIRQSQATNFESHLADSYSELNTGSGSTPVFTTLSTCCGKLS
jgi:Ras-related protein Rab-30